MSKPKQEVVFLEGPYGCGKSTLMLRMGEIAYEANPDGLPHKVDFREEDFIDPYSSLPCFGPTHGVQWASNKVIQGAESKALVTFIDGSPMSCAAYRSSVFPFELANAMLQELGELKKVTIVYFDIPEEQRWNQVQMRAALARPGNIENFRVNQLMELNPVWFSSAQASFSSMFSPSNLYKFDPLIEVVITQNPTEYVLHRWDLVELGSD